jgi:hypothetical protein
MKFEICLFLENLVRKSKFRQNLTRMTGTLHEYLCTFIIISHSFLLRTRNVSGKSSGENQSAHFVFNNGFL